MAVNNINNRRDIISTLPSEYLGYIFSFLPFKEAARTSLLSTRFRNVWRGMRFVDLQESDFVNRDDDEENQHNQRREFVEVACQWVENYKGTTLDKFSFTFSRPGDFPEAMQELVMFSTARKANKIKLDFHDPLWGEDVAQNHGGVFNLPLHVYGHKDLESLRLSACNFLVSEFKNFGALKELSLAWVELGANSVKTLLSYCPSLESFSMKKCWSIDGHLDVSTPDLGLKTLVLDKCNFVAGLVQIEAPKLRFLKYSGKVDTFYFERRLSSLQEAEIDFGLESEFSEVGALLYDLLENLFTVRVLTVCSYLLQVVPTAEEPLGLKNTLNVRHLIIKSSLHPFEFYGLRFMLKSCPLLKTLTINIGRAKIFPGYEPPFKLDPQDFWIKNLLVFKCLKKTLKVVEVTGFKGTVNEFLFLQYLISLGSVLEKVNIYLSEEVDGNGGNKETYLQRAQWVQNQFKKASQNLSISIY